MSNDTASKTPLGGRPKKADHERRLRQPKARMTIAEHEHLKKKAEAAKMTVADYLRECALGPFPGPGASPVEAGDDGASGASQSQMATLLRELNAVGINLNQLTRNYHTGRKGFLDLEQIERELARVLALVGAQFE